MYGRTDSQRFNAQLPRRAQNMQNNGYRTAPEPLDNAGFTWDRALACQSVAGEKYSLAEQCMERTHFTKLIARALTSANANAGPKTPMLTALCESIEAVAIDSDPEAALEEVLDIKHLTYGQLEHKRNPVVHSREPPANTLSYVPADKFETYHVRDEMLVNGKSKVVITTYVQAPRSEVRGGSGFDLSHEYKKSRHPTHPSQSHQV